MAVKKARVGVESGGGASVGVSFKRKDGAKHGVAKKKTEKKQRRRKVPSKGLSAEDITGVSVKQEECLIEVEPDVAENLEEGDEGHQKLLDSISKIQGKSVQASDKRGAPVWSEASEFDMPSSSKVRGELGPEDLLQSLRTKDSKDHAFLRKKVAAKLGKKPLPTPLEKPQAERASRAATYSAAKESLSEWNPVVYQNREADQLVFPLSEPKFPVQTIHRFVNKFEPSSALERRVSAILSDSPHVMSAPGQELTPFEEECLRAMSLEEQIERRDELAKMKALQSYQAAKARRRNKIKSKKYHRILKRERIRKELRDFELLQRSDPAAALEKLEELDRQRAEERMTLKHKNTGKWAKAQGVRAKHNPEARKALSEQLKLSAALTQKRSTGETSSEDEGEDGGPFPPDRPLGAANPWIQEKDELSKEDQFLLGNYRKVWKPVGSSKEDEDNAEFGKSKKSLRADGLAVASEATAREAVKRKALGKKAAARETVAREAVTRETVASEAVEDDDEEDEVEEVDLDLVFQRLEQNLRTEGEKLKRKLEEEDEDQERAEESEGDEEHHLDVRQRKLDPTEEPLEEGEERVKTLEEIASKINPSKTARKSSRAVKKQKKTEKLPEVDPTAFIRVDPKTSLRGFQVPDHANEEMDDEEEESQADLLAEAFRDDDVLEEFRAEKEGEVDSSRPKDIDLTLPGWGEWGGAGLAPSSKRIVIPAPSEVPERKDDRLKLVLIDEKANQKLREHQVSELPFPFTSVSEFQSSIRAPIGKTFVPETAFKRLAAPKVVVPLGKAIDPLDKDVVLSERKKAKLLKQKMAADGEKMADKRNEDGRKGGPEPLKKRAAMRKRRKKINDQK